MMDFTLSQTEQLIRSTARDYFASFADNKHIRGVEESVTGYDEERWDSFVQHGWTGLALPERLGGAGGSFSDLAILLAEFGYAAYPSPFLQTATAATVLDVLDVLDVSQLRDEVLSELVTGSRAVLLAPVGDGGRSARASDGGYVLAGPPIALEHAGSADLLVGLLPIEGRPGWLAFALSAPTADGPAGERDGLAVRACPSSDNERVGIVRFDGLRIGPDAMFVAEVDAETAARALSLVRLLRAAEMMGGATRVLEMTVGYVSARRQFGVSLGSFQAVRHILAGMRTHVDAAQLTVFEGTSIVSAGRPADAEAAVAGFVAGRSYAQVVVEGAQLHGGIGITVEYPLHHYFRRAKAMQTRLGSSATQLQRIADTRLRASAPDQLWQRAERQPAGCRF
jgi:3-oxocholest-4-en-26-oyl-CoA dehydrogenase beta subunit